MKKVVFTNVFRDSNESYFKGITLGNDDLIKDGGHEVEVRTYLKKHGKEGVFELLHEYDLEEDILEEYHIHKETPSEKVKREKEILKEEKTILEENAQECISVTSLMEEVFETTVTDSEQQLQDLELSDWDYENSVLYDDSPFHNHSESGWRKHPFGGTARRNVREPFILIQ